MKIYFIPFACSLALRIGVEEAGLPASFVRVTPDGRVPDGRAFVDLSPLGYVPVIEREDGTLIREGLACLIYLADLAPPDMLAPGDAAARHSLIEWLTFTATELHKAIFHPLMTGGSNEGAKALARSLVPSRFAHLDRLLAGHETLLDRFTVADAYLVAVLNWCEHAGVALDSYSEVAAWRERMRARPSVARAMAAELPLLRTS